METNTTGVIYDLQGFLLLRRVVTTPFKGTLVSRGNIVEFSARAASRMRRYLRTCQAEYRTMLTLTYPGVHPSNGRAVKEHLRQFQQRLRRYVRGSQDGFSLFWFLEFQERGAPHIHAFCTHEIPFEQVARLWYEVVGSDDIRHLHAGTRIERIRSGRYGTCSYATKYAAKHCQKDVPVEFADVGRFWGVYGERRCMAATIFFPKSSLNSPEFARFRRELAQLLDLYAGHVKKTTLTGTSRGYRLGHPACVRQVEALFHHLGTLLSQRRIVAFEYPTKSADFEL